MLVTKMALVSKTRPPRNISKTWEKDRFCEK